MYLKYLLFGKTWYQTDRPNSFNMTLSKYRLCSLETLDWQVSEGLLGHLLVSGSGTVSWLTWRALLRTEQDIWWHLRRMKFGNEATFYRFSSAETGGKVLNQSKHFQHSEPTVFNLCKYQTIRQMRAISPLWQLAEKETSTNVVLFGRSSHCCSLRAAAHSSGQGFMYCIRGESFMRILDYGPDSSPKLD